MMKRYKFECYNDEDNSTVLVEFETKSDSWLGFDGPMWRFFDFLKGCGFVFNHNASIGVMNENDEFRSADQ